jgi:hypothetical protein
MHYIKWGHVEEVAFIVNSNEVVTVKLLIYKQLYLTPLIFNSPYSRNGGSNACRFYFSAFAAIFACYNIFVNHQPYRYFFLNFAN